MIKVSQLLKTVPTADGDLDILRGINLEIAAGTSAAIVGASGSGKSTLLGLLAGMDVASGGEITLDGQELSLLDEDQRARLRAEKIGFVFQSFQLLPALTARENVMLPLELSGKKKMPIKSPTACSQRWVCLAGSIIIPRHCQGVSSSESPLRGRLRGNQRFCSLMSPPGISIPGRVSA